MAQRVKAGVIQGLITVRARRAAQPSLRFDPTWFEIGAFGDEGRTRPDLVALALRRCHQQFAWSPDPQSVIVIGDTPLDIACAHAQGCVAFAVATGHHGVDELRTAGADVVVKDLSDPGPLFELLAR